MPLWCWLNSLITCFLLPFRRIVNGRMWQYKGLVRTLQTACSATTRALYRHYKRLCTDALLTEHVAHECIKPFFTAINRR